ncbi:FG-GAP repeat domain-containing protein [Larkinella sp. VNQ87]|uniref:FG-GAP repeat domain-containing protein n=1 Tax=Larkinella sp. VNQ87 TaxID=3400921 RepID=UPI003C01AE1A
MPFVKLALSIFLSVGILSLWDATPSLFRQKDEPFSASDSAVIDQQLARQHCSSCHRFPEPALLDKKTWVTGVLPVMARRMGIRLPEHDTLPPLPADEARAISALNVYPETPQLSRADWNRIVRYYEANAPVEPLPQKPVPPVTNQLPLFAVRELSVGDKQVPQTTLLKFDPNTNQLYVGDAQHALYVLDARFHLTNTWWIDTPATDIDFPKNAAPRLLTIGIFSPSDQKLGRLMTLEKSAKPGSVPVNIRELPRPVQFATGDLNADGRDDVVVCGFGNNAGKLIWYDGFQPTKEQILKAVPGARRVEIADFNRDKKPDIMVLMAQAREEVSIYYNQGNGRFREKTVLQFSPVFGSSYFELADFNKDGFRDILLTNGDNWDYSAIRKNYHGVRIYLNDGKDNFREAWFYPLYGASKAIARDFDQDGDLDIAATAFYTELPQPEQSFVYLTNEGRLTFKPHSTPEGAHGKWLTLEAADFDHDGDVDIVLGSYFHTFGEMTQLLFKGVTSFPQLLMLENKKK